MMSDITKSGTVLAKGNKTDAEFQTFRVAEIHGEVYYWNSTVSDWCSIPSEWRGNIVWSA